MRFVARVLRTKGSEPGKGPISNTIRIVSEPGLSAFIAVVVTNGTVETSGPGTRRAQVAGQKTPILIAAARVTLADQDAGRRRHRRHKESCVRRPASRADGFSRTHGSDDRCTREAAHLLPLLICQTASLPPENQLNDTRNLLFAFWCASMTGLTVRRGMLRGYKNLV